MTDDPLARTLVKPRVHRHVVKTLAQRLLGGKFQPGDVLPPEPDMCADFKVSDHQTAYRHGRPVAP